MAWAGVVNMHAPHFGGTRAFLQPPTDGRYSHVATATTMYARGSARDLAGQLQRASNSVARVGDLEISI